MTDVTKKFLPDGQTMTRDDLIEIMARATVRWKWGDETPVDAPWIAHDIEMMATALDAAERAGWRFVPPERKP